MNDITRKNVSLRTATATAAVSCSAETLVMIEQNTLPKGNLFDVARAAGLLGAKATPSLIPHCHPIPIEHLDIRFELASEGGRGRVVIEVFAQTIYKTGIEIEAITAATIAHSPQNGRSRVPLSRARRNSVATSTIAVHNPGGR